MTLEALWSLLVIVVIALVPCVPTWWLYRKLAATGELAGPWQGFTVKIGGAAACYLIIFFTLFGVRPRGGDTGHYHTWTVTGQITFLHTAEEDDPNVNDALIRFVPPRLGVMNGGMFAWEIPVVEDANGHLVYPDLQIDMHSYGGVTVPLSRGQVYGAKKFDATFDEKHRTITIGTPIELNSLKSLPTYRGLPAPAAGRGGSQ